MAGSLREGHQLKGALAIARINLEQLSADTGISPRTLHKWGNDELIRAHSTNLLKVQRALETRGVVFVDENGEGPGVRRKKGFTASEGEQP